MSADWLIVIYVALALGGLCGLGIYSEIRRHRFGPTRSEDRIFRCEKCGYVYTDDADVDRSRCVQCGKMNEPIAF
jgi:protein-arginine kinase activator protein McsA